MTGAELELYGDTTGGDERGATNLRMRCRNGTWLEGTNTDTERYQQLSNLH